MAKLILHDVEVKFQINNDGGASLKSFVIGTILGRPREVRTRVALRDVSLEVSEGDRIGVIGHNGAGKSTLLKVLAGIYPPTSGTRYAQGRISSLFDVGLGFDPDSNGWDNIRYRGYLQGETPATLRSKAQQIADFCELGDAMNIPVRCYSAGMMLRLAFAVSTAIEPEILLVDEAMAAGDLAFQSKARQRMLELIDHARLVVAVSHDLDRVREFFPKSLWMDQGRVRMFGPSDEVVPAYRQYMQQIASGVPHPNSHPAGLPAPVLAHAAA